MSTPKSCKKILNIPAKINLTLNICGPRDDGFHQVQMFIQAIGLYDTLTLTPLETDTSPKPQHQPQLSIHSDPTFPIAAALLLEAPADNLVCKAYQKFYTATQWQFQPCALSLEKRIPIQAGLGGGSADAAATLLLLQDFFNHPLPPERLHQLASELGSDVPFFLFQNNPSGLALATGRGEQLSPLQHPLPPFPILLVQPKQLGISTQEAYQQLRIQNRYQELDLSAQKEHLQSLQSITAESIQLLEAQVLQNDFEAVVFPKAPIFTDIQERFHRLGIRKPLLSGSGSAVFGFLPNPCPTPSTIERAFPSEQFWHQVTKLVSAPMIASG